MPYKDAEKRRAAVAKAVRGHRIFAAAVERGDPRAVEADQLRLALLTDPMKPFLDMRDAMRALSKPEAAPLQPEYARVADACQAARARRPADWARYRGLRAEVLHTGGLGGPPGGERAGLEAVWGAKGGLRGRYSALMASYRELHAANRSLEARCRNIEARYRALEAQSEARYASMMDFLLS